MAKDNIRHGLEAGGAGATDAIGIGVHAHSSAEHDFPGDIRRFRHLHHLAKNQLLNDVRGNVTPGEHFANHHFP